MSENWQILRIDVHTEFEGFAHNLPFAVQYLHHVRPSLFSLMITNRIPHLFQIAFQRVRFQFSDMLNGRQAANMRFQLDFPRVKTFSDGLFALRPIAQQKIATVENG